MSSVIEEAARRLAELRRAGVERPEKGDVAPPTPEAAMHALAEHTKGAREHEIDEPRDLTPSTPPDSGRRVEIDFDWLKSRGFVTPDASSSQIAEEFRIIKRPIIRNALGQGAARIRNGNLVMVTSALPSEGKTFTSLNLALSLATEVDSTVLLVDGDVAHPSIPALLGTPHAPGLLDMLTAGDIDLGDALIRTNIDKLTLLPAGTRHRRATELLASEQMASLLREMATRYRDRIIIFDSPPLLATTEARVLASNMGQIVMVVSADSTSQHAVNHALATIEDCDVVMMVLNKASKTDVGAYYGYYGAGQAH